MLQPLLRCDLTTLYLYKMPWPIDDDSMEFVAVSWPNLRALCLDGHNTSGDPTFITAKGLHTLSLRCPKLTRFDGNLDFSGLTEGDLQFDNIRSSNRLLSQVYVFKSLPIEDPALVAAVLTSMISPVTFRWAPWADDVNRLMELFEKVRKQEARLSRGS